jgi:hypothetical protein
VATNRGLGLILITIVAGLVIGSLLGELIGYLLPPGRFQNFLLRGPTIGLTPPATLDLRLMSLTLGVAFKVNVVGLFGILIAILALRRL